MERADWLRMMRARAEALCDHLAPANWITFGLYPQPEHVRAWFDQARLVIEDEGTGDGYWHLLARKNA